MSDFRKILIAEDDAAIRMLVGEVVEESDCVPIFANNGQVALEILIDNPDILLLISDIMMPRLDGRELLMILRGQARFASLPVLLLSGVIRSPDLGKLLELGPTRFLAKPVSLKELRKHIEHTIDPGLRLDLRRHPDGEPGSDHDGHCSN